MAAAIIEAPESRRQRFNTQDESVTLTYNVWNTYDDAEVRNLVLSTAPAVYGLTFLERSTIEIEPAADTDGSVWKAYVEYVPYKEIDNQPPSPASPISFSFNTDGSRERIYQSLETVDKYVDPNLANQNIPDFKGAIGVSESGVEGVEVVVPQLAYSRTYRLPSGFISDAYITNVLNKLTGTTNAQPFLGFQPGNVLFLGARGQGTVGEEMDITFSFQLERERTFDVGPIQNVFKKGFDYLWVRYTRKEDANAKTVVERPTHVYIEKVYESANFYLLGIS